MRFLSVMIISIVIHRSIANLSYSTLSCLPDQWYSNNSNDEAWVSIFKVDAWDTN